MCMMILLNIQLMYKTKKPQIANFQRRENPKACPSPSNSAAGSVSGKTVRNGVLLFFFY